SACRLRLSHDGTGVRPAAARRFPPAQDPRIRARRASGSADCAVGGCEGSRRAALSRRSEPALRAGAGEGRRDRTGSAPAGAVDCRLSLCRQTWQLQTGLLRPRLLLLQKTAAGGLEGDTLRAERTRLRRVGLGLNGEQGFLANPQVHRAAAPV